MQVSTVLLLTLAVLIHATWNLLAKRSVDTQAFLWLAQVATVVIFAAPFALRLAPIPLAG